MAIVEHGTRRIKKSHGEGNRVAAIPRQSVTVDRGDRDGDGRTRESTIRLMMTIRFVTVPRRKACTNIHRTNIRYAAYTIGREAWSR